MHPLFEGVAGDAINHHLGSDGARDDADALAYAQNAQQAKDLGRQARKGPDGLRLQEIKRGGNPGVRDDRNAEGDQHAAYQRANQIDKHAANGSDENRHVLSPCDDAQSEQERHGQQNIAKGREVRIEHRERQADGLAPHGNAQVREARATCPKRIA